MSGPGYDNIDGLVQGTLIRDVFDVNHQKKRHDRMGKRVATNSPEKGLSAQDFAFEKDVTQEKLDALEEQRRYDEYGNNVKLADR